MKSKIYIVLNVVVALMLYTSCTNEQEHITEEAHGHEDEHQDGEGVYFSASQFNTLDMKVDTLPMRNISGVVESNGELEVPPQNEATVTAIMGANIVSIEVIEGDDVNKGQVLAYLSHPNLTRMQSDYLEAYNSLQFLEQEFERQKRLYEGEVGSGKTYQQTKADFLARQVSVKSYESQLRQLGMNPERLNGGNFYDRVPVISPIQGSVTMVEVKTGQYVQPETDLFEVVNSHHIHADLMVFEKDVYKVEKGQRVRFSVETMPNEELFAEIYSVGNKFEQDPKAVHVHAEIENSNGKLIPGMYIRGQILTDSVQTYALPEAALAREGEQYIAFVATQAQNDEGWTFNPISVTTGISANGWVAVAFAETPSATAQFAMNNAYYLMAELKKGEAGHSH